MTPSQIRVGLQIGTQPPLGTTRAFVAVARLMRLDTIEEAIAAVPRALLEAGPLLWGTPEQVASKLRAFGEAVLAPVSGLVSPRAAIRSLRALGTIARLLATERPVPRTTPTLPPVQA